MKTIYKTLSIVICLSMFLFSCDLVNLDNIDNDNIVKQMADEDSGGDILRSQELDSNQIPETEKIVYGSHLNYTPLIGGTNIAGGEPFEILDPDGGSVQKFEQWNENYVDGGYRITYFNGAQFIVGQIPKGNYNSVDLKHNEKIWNMLITHNTGYNMVEGLDFNRSHGDLYSWRSHKDADWIETHNFDDENEYPRGRFMGIYGYANRNIHALGFIIEAPVLRYELRDIILDTSEYNPKDTKIEILKKGTYRNNSNFVTSTQKMVYSESLTHERYYSDEIGAKAGVKVTYTAGVPNVNSLSYEFYAEASYSHTWGTTNINTIKNDYWSTIELPPNSAAEAIMSVQKAEIDVPYTAILVKHMLDGTEIIKPERVKGVYESVYYSDFQVTVIDLETGKVLKDVVAPVGGHGEL